MIIRIDPPIPMISPKGKCLAHFLIDYGYEKDLHWVCFQDNTGECWTWSNLDVRAQKNITHGREYISPFYDPKDVAMTKKEEESKPHPWGVFLEARMQAMIWMRDEQKYPNHEIAEMLSMDEKQVCEIFKYCNSKGLFYNRDIDCKISPETGECSYLTHIIHLKCNLCHHVEPIFCKDAKEWKCPCSQKSSS